MRERSGTRFLAGAASQVVRDTPRSSIAWTDFSTSLQEKNKKITATKLTCRAPRDLAIRRDVWRTRIVFALLPDSET
jgi:hypothetical protein